MTLAHESFREEIRVPEAADKYGLTPSQLTKLARAGTIRARKFGRDWILDEASLRTYVSQPRKTGPRAREQADTLYQQSFGLGASQAEQSDIDWIQQAIECLSYAAKAGQLSDEGQSLIIALLRREQHFQEVARISTQLPQQQETEQQVDDS